MYKCVLWGTGDVFQRNISCIRYHELCETLKVIAVTSKNIIFGKIFGYDVILKEELKNIEFDIIVVMTDRRNYFDIIKEASEIGISADKIVYYKIFQRLQINIEKYLNLKQFPPSIFANNCWGGITYHSLDLPFNSPLINMSVDNTIDYLKFCNNPQKYISEPIEILSMQYNEELKGKYPIAKCGDIQLHFIHYDSFEDAKECWERRKKRINWENLFLMMYTEDYSYAMEFLKLPYEKKICFVPFKTDEPTFCYVDSYNREKGRKEPLWRNVNKMAQRQLPYYDDVELLYGGKIKNLCKYRE